MKLSTKGRYGLRAFIDLAVCGESQPVPLASIAQRQGIDDSGSSHCSGSSQCVSKIVWKRINDSINETVDSINIGELVQESKNSKEAEN